MHKFNAKFITGVNSSVDGIKTVQSLPFGKSSGGKTLFSFRYIFQYKPIISLLVTLPESGQFQARSPTDWSAMEDRK